jgi:hypothetical protein
VSAVTRQQKARWHLERGKCAECCLSQVISGEEEEEHEPMHHSSESSCCSDNGASGARQLKRDVEGRVQSRGDQREEDTAAAAGSASQGLHAIGTNKSGQLIVHVQRETMLDSGDEEGGYRLPNAAAKIAAVTLKNRARTLMPQQPKGSTSKDGMEQTQNEQGQPDPQLRQSLEMKFAAVRWEAARVKVVIMIPARMQTSNGLRKTPNK